MESADQAIKIGFRIISDGSFQRDGWFLDEVRVTIADDFPLPPTANALYVELAQNESIAIIFDGDDPNPVTLLTNVIESLPAHGTLTDIDDTSVTSVPYVLPDNSNRVFFTADTDYSGADLFTYSARDAAPPDGLPSNIANVDLSIGTPVNVAMFNLDIDPGWIMDNGWEFGPPQGIGGDPDSAFTGINVFGYNLSGEYEEELPARRLTTLPINCTGLTRVTLEFARWLGIEAGNFDDASIEATDDGENWTTIWAHSGPDLQETAWSQQSYNVADIADDQPIVQSRWTMGPTDGDTELSGWNLDDIRITAIGTPASNSPPFAFRATDGSLESNAADAHIEVLAPAEFPCTDSFELSLNFDIFWSSRSTMNGRIRISDQFDPIDDFHVLMDSVSSGGFALNELTLTADLTDQQNVLLRYSWKSFDDEDHQLPDQWEGSAEGDGISVDGDTWYRIANLFDANLPTDTYQTVTLDLDELVDNAGLQYNNVFRMRFQQYDNNPIDSDGIAIDNVQLIQGTSDPVITTTSLPAPIIGEPYGPVQLTASGGDPPLAWSTPIIYAEDQLGQSPFLMASVPQSWQGDDDTFDYVLPFSFSFYGEEYTTIKVATNGWINFGNFVGSTHNNSEILFAFNTRIAPLWDDLRTDQGGDVYIDASVTGQVTIRWDAVARDDLAPCNFSATLFDDSRAQFDYGAGNTGLTPTTIGQYEPVIRVEDQSERSDEKIIFLTALPGGLGDFESDGDLDLLDFAGLLDCFTGMTSQAESECLVMDINLDGFVDLDDFSLFQGAI